MKWYINYNSSDLMHHGIKGQRWGYRRYQNEDGSLTPAGEKRYNRITNKINRRMDSRNKGLTKRMNKFEKGSLAYNLSKYAIKQNNKTKKEAAEYFRSTDVRQQKKDKRYFRFKALSGLTDFQNSKGTRIFSALDFADNMYMKSVDIDTINRGKQYTRSTLKSNRRFGTELAKMPVDKAYDLVKNSVISERRMMAVAAAAAGY